MGEFDFEKLDREVDDLLADVKGLLDEPEEDEAELDDLEEDETEPEDAEDDAEAGEAEDAVSDDRTIIFRPLTAYEQSKAEYQTAKRAEYERARAQERQNRLAERQRREAEEDRALRQMEDRRKKRRTREAPTDPAAYSEWLYQQGEDPETQHRRETMAERAEQAPVRGRKQKEKTQKKKGGAGWRILLVLVILLALGAGFFHFVWAKQPKADDGGLDARKKGCSTILIAGTDEGGYRTDTMMLFSVDREAKTMSLVSIPRDTLVYCEYSVPKLNSAYGWAGGGDDGMQELLTRVEEIVGFRPDGYVVTDLACFEELVDLMGGVTFDVPVEMHYNDPSQNLYIDLSAGEQKLDGAQAMQVMRFRSGYADADLGRVKVQRDFLAAALHQWASVKNAYKLPSAIRLITEHTKTDLTSAQLAWLAESAALCGTDGLTMATMPGSAAWIGGGSYYVLDAAQVADLVNEKLNPYQKEVTVVDLAIRAG